MGVNSQIIRNIEVTIIGTGGGYGECVVAHIGNNNWIVIDSCENPNTKAPLALEYLRDQNVDIETNVKLLICSHWHDDHIKGMSKILNECKNASFVMARPSDMKKFLLFVNLDHEKVSSSVSLSSTDEFNSCMNILRSRKGNFVNACQDRVLFCNTLNDLNVSVVSLSPSDLVINEYDSEISQLITDYGSQNRKVVINTPNDKSVVILIKINNASVLLGSDLEVSNDERKGWMCILNTSTTFSTKASLLKVPHHGSQNGFLKKLWDEKLCKDLTVTLTPWKKGVSYLPQQEMLSVFNGYSSNLYLTSQSSVDKPKERDRNIEKCIRKMNETLREIKFVYGYIRCTLSDSKSDIWEVELFGDAYQYGNN